MSFIKNFTLQEAICLGFCAIFIIITRAALRLHLNIPGHAMFFTMFFLILGRGCVLRLGAATLVGLVAGLLCTLLGMGKGGPLIILKFVVPGLIVDCGSIVYSGFSSSYAACAVIGAIAAASRFLTIVVVEWVVGMDWSLILQHAVISSSSGVLFGVAGSMMVPPVVRRLKASGLIDGNG